EPSHSLLGAEGELRRQPPFEPQEEPEDTGKDGGRHQALCERAQEQRKTVLVAPCVERFGQAGRRRARGLLKRFVREWVEVRFRERKHEMLAYPNREAAVTARGERNHPDRIAAYLRGERLEARLGGPLTTSWIGAEGCSPERDDVSVLECERFWL